MRNRSLLVLAALVSVAPLGACQDREQDVANMPTVPAAFPELLVPPGGRLVARAGSEDALQLIFQSPNDPADVATVFRGRLSTDPWRIIGDTRDGDVTILHAESGGRPVWIRIMPEPGVGSRVELNGAVVGPAPRRDPATSTAQPTPRSERTTPVDTARRVRADSTLAP